MLTDAHFVTAGLVQAVATKSLRLILYGLASSSCVLQLVMRLVVGGTVVKLASMPAATPLLLAAT